MDSTNTNQNDNQAPVAPAPAMPSAPVPPVAAMPEASATGPVSAAPEMPVAPEPPVMPEAPAAPTSPVMPGSPAMPEAPAAPTTSAMPTNPNVAMPAIDPSLIEQGVGTAGFSTTSGISDVMVGATDPITMPNPPKAPDPVEEELKAPMTAAAPVPGSIGSAISMPAEKTGDGDVPPVGLDMNATPQQTPSVAFNDPASAGGKAANPAAPQKKKINKKTLIMLCGVAGIAVVALVIVLVMMMV